MTRPLHTDRACAIVESLRPLSQSLLHYLNECNFSEAGSAAVSLKEFLKLEKEQNASNEEELLNDFFVLERYCDFLTVYIILWERILEGKFSDSWNTLHDLFDLLRLLKRFSNIEISFFEQQLTDLEKAYPYRVFTSIGAIFEYYECTICRFDINSPKCSHLRNELYGGRLAGAKPINLVEIDHVAIVSNPRDKRCVIPVYDDTDDAFKIVRYLAELVTSGKLPILFFEGLAFSIRRLPNPEYQKLGRNEPCFCGSEKKFKRCCESKEYIENERVDIVGRARPIEHALV
jgi:hypothetical protein